MWWPERGAKDSGFRNGLGEMKVVEPPDSTAFFSLRRTPETLAAHEWVGRFQRTTFSVGGLRREKESEEKDGEREEESEKE